jgi:protein ImuB
MLWLALELPSLPLQIAERAGVSPEPLVISDGPAQRPWIACANEAARQAGVREGQAVAAARAIAGELRVVPRDAQGERSALERLAAWAGQFTPMVCLDGEGIVMEVESSLRLFEGHARLMAAVQRGIRELGFHAASGLAPTPLAARLFARAEAQGRAVRSCLALADLRERLGDLPLFLLDWPQKTLAHLTDLGVLRLRDALELPAGGLARRFGPELAASLDRLLGCAPDPREPYVPPPRLRSRLELPAEAEGVEALLFPLRRLLAEFEGALRGRGAGVQHLLLLLEHGRRARTRVPLQFASPEREADFILAIAREKLGRLSLVAPTLALDLRAEALLPYAPREAAWLPGAKEQALDRERLVERLAARLGAERVFGIALAADHRPERDWMPAFAGATARGRGDARRAREAGTLVSSPRPVWLLRRPQPLVCHGGQPTLQGALVLCAGPERIESGWWDGEEVHRDYYVAASGRGEAYWIFREHRDPDAWYLHGMFA